MRLKIAIILSIVLISVLSFTSCSVETTESITITNTQTSTVFNTTKDVEILTLTTTQTITMQPKTLTSIATIVDSKFVCPLDGLEFNSIAQLQDHFSTEHLSEIPRTTETVTITVSSTPQSPAQKYSITQDISYIITKKNDSFWTFSWQFSMKNMTSESASTYIEIHFLNNQGYSLEYDLYVGDFASMEERVIRGESLIDTELAPQVVDATIEVTWY